MHVLILFRIVRSINRAATFSPRGETGYEILPDRFEHWEIQYGVRSMKRGNHEAWKHKYFEFLFGKTKQKTVSEDGEQRGKQKR